MDYKRLKRFSVVKPIYRHNVLVPVKEIPSIMKRNVTDEYEMMREYGKKPYGQNIIDKAAKWVESQNPKTHRQRFRLLRHWKRVRGYKLMKPEKVIYFNDKEVKVKKHKRRSK